MKQHKPTLLDAALLHVHLKQQQKPSFFQRATNTFVATARSCLSYLLSVSTIYPYLFIHVFQFVGPYIYIYSYTSSNFFINHFPFYLMLPFFYKTPFFIKHKMCIIVCLKIRSDEIRCVLCGHLILQHAIFPFIIEPTIFLTTNAFLFHSIYAVLLMLLLSVIYNAAFQVPSFTA
jgi:hypothetical protein